ncbi:hypothetical protein FBY33_1713 [Arthrobacter sp. SLBN-112]|nr:hypothetical protein FBY33_1713 [Arthrobacter sp. SLBN-112]
MARIPKTGAMPVPSAGSSKGPLSMSGATG